jgi:hypothetical protein
MTGLRLMALWLGLLAVTGCRIEDRTPTGTRRDEDIIQHLLNRYARQLSQRDWSGLRGLFWRDGTFAGPIGPGDETGSHETMAIDTALGALQRWLDGVQPRHFDVRVLRTDLRQEGDLAAAWLITRRRTPAHPAPVERDWTEHVVLRRIDGHWRIQNLSVASAPRGSTR